MQKQTVFTLIQNAEFKKLFNQLGWDKADTRQSIQAGEQAYALTSVAEKRGFIVFVCETQDELPDYNARRKIDNAIAKLHFEHLIIYRDGSKQIWQLALREPGKPVRPSEVHYRGGDPLRLFEKLRGLLFTLDEEGSITLVDVKARVQDSFSRAEKVTKQFYTEFKEHHLAFIEAIQGLMDEQERRWYASVLINRLMFIWFLQKKGFLDKGDRDYLPRKLAGSQARGEDLFYRGFLRVLFFDGFAKHPSERTAAQNKLLGEIRYLNGGLFLPHRLEHKTDIQIPDYLFRNLFLLFNRYAWNLSDTPSGEQDEINPDVLGYIFEKYINQKQFGAYYTRPEITEYLCEHTIYPLILGKLQDCQSFEDWQSLSEHLDAALCRQLLHKILPGLSLLDPACGSGAFLVAAMKILIAIYSELMEAIPELGDAELIAWRDQIEAAHPSLTYYIKKRIITDNLYGVDIMEEAAEIAKLRLFLALVASAERAEHLEPLPNIDFNVLAGNSLVGLLAVDADAFGRIGGGALQGQGTLLPPVQGDLLQAQASDVYRKILADKNRSIELYKKHAFQAEDEVDQEVRIIQLREHIEKLNRESQAKLNALLLGEFERLKIQFEQTQADSGKKKTKPLKRPLTMDDIARLQPFHWGYHFDKILAAGGFDAIIANPPWEVFKPNAKEFFLEYSAVVSKKNMTIKEFEKEQDKLLQDPEIQAAWLAYQSQFPHVSEYYRAAPQFKNQSVVINGRKTSSDLNLYKLFLEQCFNLLRKNGACGIIIPSGIYTDLGTTGLRHLLFSQARIENLFGLSNEKFIFEGVHHSFKIALLTFRKGGTTDSFNAAFRINPREAVRPEHLTDFFTAAEEHIELQVDLIKKLSPDSWSVMEFKNDTDVRIAKKMLAFPLLGEKLEGTWNLVLSNEFHMRNDSHLFYIEYAPGRLPLFTGKMFNQFTLTDEHSGYWIDEQEGRKTLLGKAEDIGQVIDYQKYRWVHRRIARNTDSRTMITMITPKNVFTEVNSTTLKISESNINELEMLYLCAISNSYVFDWLLRKKVSSTLNMFYIYQLPVPRLTASPENLCVSASLRETDTNHISRRAAENAEKNHSTGERETFQAIVRRAAQLICTAPEFDDLARAIGMEDLCASASPREPQRKQLRAELDGLIAHLYGLSEKELLHILKTFPLVSDEIKNAVQNAYRDVERGVIQ